MTSVLNKDQQEVWQDSRTFLYIFCQMNKAKMISIFQEC